VLGYTDGKGFLLFDAAGGGGAVPRENAAVEE
jgi:hypothetical protein